MKVLMIDALTGNDYTLCLCSGLKSIGSNVTLIVPEFREINTATGLDVKFFAPTKKAGYNKLQKGVRYFYYLYKLCRYIKSNKIDVVHFQFFRRERIESLYFYLLRFLGINLVFTAHNVLPHDKRKIDYFLRFLVYKSAKAIIAHSQYIKNQLIEVFKVDGKKIWIIPHGNFDIYLPRRPMTKTESRKKLNIAEQDYVLLFFGAIRKNKGLDLLLDAFEMIALQDYRFRLVIAGRCINTHQKKSLVSKISKLKTADHITLFSEFIPNENVATFFLAADAVVLPYMEIYHSGVLHLAYSFAKPVIATRVGDFEEVIDNGRGGYIIEKNDCCCLAETIQKAFLDKKKLEHMGRFARQISETKYSWSKIADQTNELYKNLSFQKVD